MPVSRPREARPRTGDDFPKGTDLRQVTAEELQRVADDVNTRPRESLEWARPADRMSTAIDGATTSETA